MKSMDMKFYDAADLVCEKRPIVCPNLGFIKQLKIYETVHFNLDGDTDAHRNYRRLKKRSLMTQALGQYQGKKKTFVVVDFSFKRFLSLQRIQRRFNFLATLRRSHLTTLLSATPARPANKSSSNIATLLNTTKAKDKISGTTRTTLPANATVSLFRLSRGWATSNLSLATSNVLLALPPLEDGIGKELNVDAVTTSNQPSLSTLCK
jgi:hypothetical protein